MFKKKRNKNSMQNLESAKEFGRNKVNKEDDQSLIPVATT